MSWKENGYKSFERRLLDDGKISALVGYAHSQSTNKATLRHIVDLLSEKLGGLEALEIRNKDLEFINRKYLEKSIYLEKEVLALRESNVALQNDIIMKEAEETKFLN